MLKKYLFKNFSSSFFPIFFTLFSITSIVYLVKIASLTSVIQLNILELLLLYVYTIPKILFFVLPISYFVGLVMTFSKLSGEYELLVISSFGKNPISILKYFLPLTLVLSFCLLVISEISIPKASFLNSKFIYTKKNEAQFNIKASQFGQEFGPWLIFIKDETKDKKLIDVKLLSKDGINKKFIIASTANMENINGNLNLSLNKGKSFLINDSLEQINYEKMILLDNKEQHSYSNFTNIIDYWEDLTTNKSKAKDFVFNILVSIFPLISLLFIVIFGYFNPRYEKNKTTLYSSLLILLFFILSKQLIALNPFLILIAMPIFWVLISYIIYTKTIKKKY
jgi:lipopolysaccharide export system permease protein